MVLRFVERLWRAGRSAPERERQREQERLRQYERLDEKQRQERREESDDIALAVLVSDELQRFEQQLRDDLSDAITAARMAFAQAEAAEQAALEALRAIEADAVVLSDGRRVYFDAEGNLIGEDHRPIIDPGLLAEARALLADRPASSTYEDYRRADEAFERIRARKAALAKTLDRLDDLKQRIDRGDLNADQLIEAREELDRILADMPPAALQLYRELQAAREHDRPDAPEVDRVEAATVQSEFERASAQQSEALERARDSAEPNPDRQPVYKSVPPFE